jgi:hypothetical protein
MFIKRCFEIGIACVGNDNGLHHIEQWKMYMLLVFVLISSIPSILKCQMLYSVELATLIRNERGKMEFRMLNAKEINDLVKETDLTKPKETSQ